MSSYCISPMSSVWFANIPIRANHAANTSRTERSVGLATTLTTRLFFELTLELQMARDARANCPHTAIGREGTVAAHERKPARTP